MSAKLTETQRGMDQAAELSSTSDEEALVLRQKPTLMQVRDKGTVTLQQWKVRQLQRLAEELKAEWQEARLQQVRDMERLYLAHLLDEATGRTVENNLYKPNQRGTAKHVRAKERHRAAFREEKGRREEHPRQHPKTRKKATCSERRSTKVRVPSPNEKGKGKRVSSSKSNYGYQPLGPRLGRGMDLAKLNPLLAGGGEIEYMEEIRKETPREGRRPMGRGTSRFGQSISHNSRGQSLQGKTNEQSRPPSSSIKQEATSQGAPYKYSDKNQWQKEIESAFEELFNTNRKLKKHLNLHMEQRLKADQISDEQQSYSEMPGESSDTLKDDSTEEVGTSGESQSPTEVESPEMWAKPTLKQILGEVEYPKYQLTSKHLLKTESLTPVPEAGTSTELEDSCLETSELGQEALTTSTVEDDSLKPPPEKEEEDPVASWMASRQKQKAEMEQRRQKTLFKMTEHPDMSLEIHYKAELEEERRERRRMRLALLKSYPTGIPHAPPLPVPERTTPLDSGLLDEDKQNQMIRDLQQQILEQNKLHKQFLDKARKRLQEFQKTF